MENGFNSLTSVPCAFRAALLLASLALAGCSGPAPGGLLQQARLLAEGDPAALSRSPTRVMVAAGETLVVAAVQFDADVVLELRDAADRVLATSAGPAGMRGRELLVWQAPDAASGGAVPPADLRVLVRVVGPDRPASGRARLSRVAVVESGSGELRAALEQTGRAMAEAGIADAAARAAAFEDLERRWLMLGERELAAEAALQLAAVRYVELEQWSEAVDAAARAEAALRESGAAKGTADATLLRGIAASEQLRARGEPNSAALATILEARRQYQQLQLPVAAAEALNYAGMSQFYGGEIAASVGSFEAAAEEFGRAAASEPRRLVLQNIAAVQLDRGEYRQAARAYAALLADWPDGDAHALASVLQNAALAVSYLGDYEQALSWCLRSLDIARRIENAGLQARALQCLGVAHLQLGQSQIAVSHLREAERLFARATDRVDQAVARNELGNALRAQGELDAAVREHRDALALIGTGGAPAARARALASIGLTETARGRHREAERFYNEALGLKLPATAGAVLRARYGRAQSWAATGRAREAVTELDALIATVRAEFLTDQEALALGLRAQLRRDGGDLAGALKDSAEALVALERLTAGTTNPDNRVTLARRVRDLFELRIDLLAGGDNALGALQVVDRYGSPGSWSVLAAKSQTKAGAEIEEVLAQRRYRLEALTEQTGADSSRVDALRAEIAVLRSRLAQQRTGSNTGRAETLDQRRLAAGLPTDAILLVYSLGRERSWLFQLTGDRLVSHPLAAAPVIDDAVLKLLNSIRQFRDPERELLQLQRLLLPVELAQLEGRRLFVVTDGSLAALPWALMKQRTNAAAVQQLARATDLLRVSLPFTPAATGWSAALFGDAQFSRDPRGFVPLPGTRREIDVVRSRIGGERVQTFTGFAASRQAFLGLPAGDLDILHVATHAYLDAHVPELSALVLSQVDASSNPVVGDVRPSDLLRWRRAPRLVVLSACDAAAEPSRQAPGLLSLTRALHARGTEHVVASLWPVADAAAADLMEAFYTALIDENLPPDRALAAAQRVLQTSSQWKAPFFWAGFVVIGSGT
jgi:CHAT domain-containing protein/tetratricopeptide (TPR) repeat protein